MQASYRLVPIGAAAEAEQPTYAAGRPGPLLSCLGARAIRITIEDAAGLVSVRLRLVGGSAIDTWQSWYRAPLLPPPNALRVLGPAGDLGAQERRFALDRSASAATAQRIVDGTLIELLIAPCAAGPLTLELRFTAADPVACVLAGIELATAPWAGEPLPDRSGPEPAQLPTPQPQLPRAGDPLADQIAALAQREGLSDPTLDQVARLALPYRGGALLGIVEGPVAYRLWDGGLVIPDRRDGSHAADRILYRLLPAERIEHLTRSEQRLRRGYLPIAELEQEGQGGAQLKQTAFIDRDGDLRVRFQLSGNAPSLWTERCVRASLHKTENEPRLRAQELQTLPLDPGAERVQLGDHAGTRAITAHADGLAAELWLPLRDPQRAAPRSSFAAALADVEDEAERYLHAGTTLELPDARLNRLWRALLLHNRLFVREGKVRYGLFPGVYDGGLFGVEEGWNIVALAQYGHRAEAAAALKATFFDPEFLKKEGQHHQYRNGLALTYLADVIALSRDEALLRELWPIAAESAEWIAAAFRSTQVLEGGERPPHFGLMPKHTYGGDLKDPAYSLYGSSACWRGLRDAALLAEQIGDPRAVHFSTAAAEARANLHTAAERIFRQDGTPPFLPFRTDETTAEPSARDYHQLFASLVLETALFGWRGRWAQHLTDYLYKTGRQVLGVARFDQWFGRLGVDAEYSRGTQLCHLYRRDFERFWLGVLGQVGLSCDPDTFVSPETAIVYFTAAEHHARMRTLAEEPCRFDSDPCSAGTAVMLQYVRYLLCTEERDEDDRPTGTLWLLPAVPASWFRAGELIVVRDLPTAFGAISLRCESTGAELRITIETERPVPIELFYRDVAGGRRSRLLTVSGRHELGLSRAE